MSEIYWLAFIISFQTVVIATFGRAIARELRIRNQIELNYGNGCECEEYEEDSVDEGEEWKNEKE